MAENEVAQEERENTTEVKDGPVEEQGAKTSNADTQAYAEGARKAEKRMLTELGFKTFDELKAALNPQPVARTKQPEEKKKEPQLEGEDRLNTLIAEVEALRADKYAATVGIVNEHREDLVALMRGKGLALTEANIKAEADNHPEWQTGLTRSQKVGATSGSTASEEADERTQAEIFFGHKFR